MFHGCGLCVLSTVQHACFDGVQLWGALTFVQDNAPPGMREQRARSRRFFPLFALNDLVRGEDNIGWYHAVG